MRRLVLALCLSLTTVLAGPSASVLAAVAGHEERDATSATNSSNKSVTASCPAGKKVVGAAGSKSFAAGGQVVLSRIRPDSGLPSVNVTGLEDENGFAGNWAATAYAICATPLPSLQRVAATSAASSSNKSVTASCPAGKKVLGAGGEITGGAGQVVLGAIRPSSDLSGVTATGLEDGTGFAGNWSVTAYAVCATPPAGLQRVAVTSATNSQTKDAIAPCPGGKGLLGIGGEVAGGAGQVALELFPSVPVANPTSASARGLEDENGYAANWTVTAYAICGAISTRVVDQTSVPPSATSAGAFPSCPGGLRPQSAGGDISGGAGQALLDGLAVLGNPPANTGVFASEDETGFAGNWLLRGYAICATPPTALEQVVAESATASDPAASASVFCPAGKKLVGGGGAISFGYGQVVLDDIVPDSSLTNMTATGYEDPTGYSSNWRIDAYAICATPPPGLQLVYVETPSEFDPGSATATCPAGKNLLGGGADIVSGGGRVVLDDVRPDGLLRSVTATGRIGENGISSPWSIIAFAICANP